jgi:hypothetical protein
VVRVTSSSPNKLVASGSAPSRCHCGEEALLAGRGGKEEGQIGAVRCPAASLLAGLGGEGELRCGALVLDLGGGSCPLRRCYSRWRSTRLPSSLACRGGEEGSGSGAATP